MVTIRCNFQQISGDLSNDGKVVNMDITIDEASASAAKDSADFLSRWIPGLGDAVWESECDPGEANELLP